MQTGAALQGYWTNAVLSRQRSPAITFDWYRSFIQGCSTRLLRWFAKLSPSANFWFGVALILGMFVGIAALSPPHELGYIMAGSTSSNPLLLIGAIVLSSPGRPPATMVWTSSFCPWNALVTTQD